MGCQFRVSQSLVTRMVFDSSLIRGLMDPIPNNANGVPSLLAGKRNTKQEKTFLGGVGVF